MFIYSSEDIIISFKDDFENSNQHSSQGFTVENLLMGTLVCFWEKVIMC